MNTILFYRILTVDFSGMFRSASFKPESKSVLMTKDSKQEASSISNYLKNVWQETDQERNGTMIKFAQD